MGNRASSTDSISQGEQPQGRGASEAGVGAQGKTRGEGFLPSLWQCLQDGVHFLSHSRQCELKLVLGEQRRGHEGPASPAQGVVCTQGERGSPVWGGTLVCTMPGRWSRMCSSVAAMSISFTPGAEGDKGAKRGVQGLST